MTGNRIKKQKESSYNDTKRLIKQFNYKAENRFNQLSIRFGPRYLRYSSYYKKKD
jgi:hypothetical protein